jgi:hypothetical protein
MKASHLLNALTRIVAIPVAWCIAIGPGSAAVSELSQTRAAAELGPGIPPERMQVLHSLLGKDVVPLELSGAQSAPPLVVAGPGPGETPPPPPP